jgi:hypothetical protein
MNCKPGDLAVIVRSYAENEGRIVRCVRLVNYLWNNMLGGAHVLPTWEIDQCLTNPDGRLIRLVPDNQLRPIRPSDGEDETLTWAGKPQETVREVISSLTKGEA